jgi:hypothetical protein
MHIHLRETPAVHPYCLCNWLATGARDRGSGWVRVAGKVAADLVFYLPVIFMYERKKRWRQRVVGP